MNSRLLCRQWPGYDRFAGLAVTRPALRGAAFRARFAVRVGFAVRALCVFLRDLGFDGLRGFGVFLGFGLSVVSRFCGVISHTGGPAWASIAWRRASCRCCANAPFSDD